MWAIQAQVCHERDGWKASTQVPTFYLDENVQGIISEEHAVKVATSIINPTADADLGVYVTAVKL
jgi:hypothetical protein